jgi:hypothetical protein
MSNIFPKRAFAAGDMDAFGGLLEQHRVERTSSRAGFSPAEVQRFSRRTVTTIIYNNYAAPHL